MNLTELAAKIDGCNGECKTCVLNNISITTTAQDDVTRVTCEAYVCDLMFTIRDCVKHVS